MAATQLVPGLFCSVKQMDGNAGEIGDVRGALLQSTNANKRKIHGVGKEKLEKLFNRLMA